MSEDVLVFICFGNRDCKWTCDKCSINAVEIIVVSSDIYNHNNHHKIW